MLHGGEAGKIFLNADLERVAATVTTQLEQAQ
jgi:hypothetical protein